MKLILHLTQYVPKIIIYIRHQYKNYRDILYIYFHTNPSKSEVAGGYSFRQCRLRE